MSKKFENIKNEEIKLNELGEVELSEELSDAVSGGFSPEEEDDEHNVCQINHCKKEL